MNRGERQAVHTVVAGEEIAIDVIRWHEPDWKDGCPTVILRPVVRAFEDGVTCEGAAERLAEDICIDDGKLFAAVEGEWWRTPTLARLRRVFNRTMREPAYSSKYECARFVARFFPEDLGDPENLMYDVRAANLPPPAADRGGEEKGGG